MVYTTKLFDWRFHVCLNLCKYGALAKYLLIQNEGERQRV